jgi:hypothetical protein
MPTMQRFLLKYALKKLRKQPKAKGSSGGSNNNDPHPLTPPNNKSSLHRRQVSFQKEEQQQQQQQQQHSSSPALKPTYNESPEASPQSSAGGSNGTSPSKLFWEHCESPTRSIRAVPPSTTTTSRRVPSFDPPPFLDERSDEFLFHEDEDEEAELLLSPPQEFHNDEKECDVATTIHTLSSCSVVSLSCPDLPVRRRRVSFDECIHIREIRHVIDLMLEEEEEEEDDDTSTTPPPPPTTTPTTTTTVELVIKLKSQLWFQSCDFDAIRQKAFDLIDLVERKGGTVQNFAPSRNKPYIRGLESLLHPAAVQRHAIQDALWTAVLKEQYHQYHQHGRIVDTVALAECSLQLSQSSLIEAQLVAQKDAKAVIHPKPPPILRTKKKNRTTIQ